MSPAPPLLKIDAEHQHDAYVVHVEGELDLAGCPALESVLTGAEQSQADRILVDLDELSFIDASGLRVLVGASRRSASNGNRLRLTRGRGEVARMFGLSLLDLMLPFTEPVAPDGSRKAERPELC